MGDGCLVVVAGLALASLVTAWFFVLEPYQRSRILDVVDPGRDPLSSPHRSQPHREERVVHQVGKASVRRKARRDLPILNA